MRWSDPGQPDPITDEQVRMLFELLGGSVSDEELEGFLGDAGWRHELGGLLTANNFSLEGDSIFEHAAFLSTYSPV